MQKEMNLSSKHIILNFYYNNLSLKPAAVKKMKEWLDYSISMMEYMLYKQELKSVTTDCGIKKYEINLTLCGDSKIKTLNKKFRNKEKVTDVLSFPLQENLRMEDVDVFNHTVNLGDIFICKNVCTKQAKEFELSFEEEFCHLFCHGFLHVCGYDHEISKEEEELMFKLEEKLLKYVSRIKKKGSQ